ncbi:MAG: glycosyltransferase family 2 protein [Pseudomonadota bacterium]
MTQKVSIIIAAWNAKDTILDCVKSALSQSYSHIEIIIVDDCSTDNTKAVLQDILSEHHHVKYFRTPQNSGPSAARNFGISSASGDWIAILDADDSFDPKRIEAMLDFAQKYDLDIAFDDLSICTGHITAPLIGHDLDDIHWTAGHYAKQNRPYVNKFITGFLKPLFKRSFLVDHGLAYHEALRNSEDYMMILEAIIKGAKVKFLNRPLYNYVVLGQSLSGKFNEDHHIALIKAEKELLEAHKARLAFKDIQGIEAHIKALEEAHISNKMFQMLREKEFVKAFIFVISNPSMLHKNISRVTRSIFSKLLKISNRGR